MSWKKKEIVTSYIVTREIAMIIVRHCIENSENKIQAINKLCKREGIGLRDANEIIEDAEKNYEYKIVENKPIQCGCTQCDCDKAISPGFVLCYKCQIGWHSYPTR